jgi:predicted dehydrogenase
MQVQHPVKITVIGGSGYIGQRHCEYIGKNSSIAQLVSIVDPSDAATAIATRYAVPLYSTIDELLNSTPKPDACIVCTPNHTHVPICIQLAQNGIKAILCEKPISTIVASARTLIQVASQHNVHLLIGHHRRFSPYAVALKGILSSGILGEITALSGLWTALKPASYFTNPQHNWRASKSTGGGVILNNFIHEIDLVQHLFGPVSRIHAEKGISHRRSHPSNTTEPSPSPSPLEETIALTLRFSPTHLSRHGGAIIGTFLLSDHLPSPHNFETATGENPSIPFAPGTDIYRIFGTKGTLSFPDMTLSTYSNPASDPSNAEEEQEGNWHNKMRIQKIMVRNQEVEPLGEQLKFFVGLCTDTGRSSQGGIEESKGRGCTGEEGLSALKVCEAIMRAVDTDEGCGTVSIDHNER